MATTLKGHCLCGKITYTIDNPEGKIPDTAVCHCDSCQRIGGAPYSFLIGVDESKLHIHGPIASYAEKTDSDNISDKLFCPECGSAIANKHHSALPTIFVKAGTLDMDIKQQLQPPTLEVYTKRKLPSTHLSVANSFTGMPM